MFNVDFNWKKCFSHFRIILSFKLWTYYRFICLFFSSFRTGSTFEYKMTRLLFCTLFSALLCACRASSLQNAASDIFYTSIDDGDNCLRQYFDQNSFVCSCDLKGCPQIEPLRSVSKGFVYSWESSRDQHRFHQSFLEVSSLRKNFPRLKRFNRSALRVDLNLDDRRQIINGFGAAVTDAAGINLASLPANLSERILIDYFSKSGIDYSAARVPIGGTDFSTRKYTYDDNNDDDLNLEHFALEPEDNQYKIPMIKRALELKGGKSLKLLGSVWSPPAWMKTNNRIDGSGFLKGAPGGPYYKALAKYYVKFLEAYSEEGIDFWGITTINEPTNAVTKKDFFFNCLGMTPENVRDFVKLDLGPILKDAGYGTDKLELILHDDIRDFLPNYTEVVLVDNEAASYVTGIGFHWYKNGIETFYENLDRAHNNFPNHFLFGTEASEGFARFSTERAQLGNWTRAETYAIDIIEGLNRYSTGWLDWNLVLDTAGGPSWAENWTDGLILIDANITTYYRNPMFYSLGHFSKFIPPGSVYIGHKIYNQSSDLLMAAFIDPTDQMVMVILNSGDKTIDLMVNNFAEEPIPVRVGSHSIKTLVTPATATKL